MLLGFDTKPYWCCKVEDDRYPSALVVAVVRGVEMLLSVRGGFTAVGH